MGRSTSSTRRLPPRSHYAQIAKFGLEQAGFKVNLKPQPFGVAINTMGTKGNEMDAFAIGWIADYFDPYDFINVLLDGPTSRTRTTTTTRTGTTPSTTG